MLKPVKVREKSASITAMQFVTNNENGSPQMDAIVNWLNQGQQTMVAWHNGTNIYVNTQYHNQVKMNVGDWVVRDVSDRYASVIALDRFNKEYEVVQACGVKEFDVADVIREWSRGSVEAGMFRVLYLNPEYRLMGDTVNGEQKWYAKYPYGGQWYKAGGINLSLSSDAVGHLQHLQVTCYDNDTGGYRLTQEGKKVAVEMFKSK